MAPIRRYLRITKYSVLECRIYLDNPALAQTWLLNPRKPVLPRVIESVRPLVLPKLREEKERSRKKSTKKKTIRDVVVEDDFEVSIFLTETNTRHSLLTKQKHFRDKVPKKLGSNSNKLTGETNDSPVDVDGDSANVPIHLREESDDDTAALDTIPIIAETTGTRQSKRLRVAAYDKDTDFEPPSDDEDANGAEAIEIDSDVEAPPHKRPRKQVAGDADDDDEEDKKKMAMDVSYEGFAIYGRVLCLVVKRREPLRGAGSAGRGAASAGSGSEKPGGQAMMENWISSTQMPAGEDAS